MHQSNLSTTTTAESEIVKTETFSGDSFRKQFEALGHSPKRSSSAGHSLKGRIKMSREEFISINEQILQDDDHIIVPTSKDTILCSNSSTPLPDHYVQNESSHEENESCESQKSEEISSNKSPILGDGDIIKTGLFSNCSIDLEVLDENGDKATILWHEPGMYVYVYVYGWFLLKKLR